jgi:hypothetical protein
MLGDEESRELRRRLRAYYQAHAEIGAGWSERGYAYPAPAFPVFPDECRGMTCGARTRAGTACRRRDLGVNGRCRLHGGLSTGPRTVGGKARSARNLPNPMRR